MALAAGLGSLKPVFLLGVGERGSCWKARVRLQQQLWDRGGTQGFYRATCSSSGSSGQGNRHARRKVGGEKLSKKDILLVEQLKNFIAQQDLPANQLPSIKELTSRGRSDLAYAVRSRGYQAVSRMLGNPRFRRGGGSGSSSDSDSGGRAGRRELASRVTSSVNVSVQVEVVSEQALTGQIEDVVEEKFRGSSFSSPDLDSPSVPNGATLQQPGAATPPGETIAEDNAEQVLPSSSVGVPGSGEDVGASKELEAAAALASEQESSISSVSQQDLLTLQGIEDSSPVAPSPPPPADSEKRSVPVLSSEEKVSLWVSTGQSSSLRESASSETGNPQEEDLVPQDEDFSLPVEVWTFLGQDAPDSASDQDTENVSPSEQRLQPEAGSTERSVPTLSSEERARLFVTTGQTSLLGQTPSFSSTEPVASASLSDDLAVGQEASVSPVSAQDGGDLQLMEDVSPVVQPPQHEAVAEDESVSILSLEERARVFASTGLPSLLEESSVQESESSETAAQQPDIPRSDGLASEQQGSALATELDSEILGTASVSPLVPDPPSRAVSDEWYVFDLLMYEREMLSASMGLSSPLEESGSSEAPSGGIGKLNTAEGDFAKKEKLGQQGSVPITEQESANQRTESDSPVVQELQSQAGSDERSVLDRAGEFAEKEKLGQQGSVLSTTQESAELWTESDSPVVQELQSQAGSDERFVLDTAGELAEKEKLGQQGSVLSTTQESAELWTESDSPVVQELQSQAGSDERFVLDTAGEFAEKEKLGQQGSVPSTKQEPAELWTESDSSVVQELQSLAGSDERSVSDTAGEFAEKEKLGQQGSVPSTKQESAELWTESDSPVVQELQSQAGSNERSVFDLSIEERARSFFSTKSFEAPSGGIGKLNTARGEFMEKQKLGMTEQESADLWTENDSPVVQEPQSQAGSDGRSVLDLSIEERARLFLSSGSFEAPSGDIGKLNTTEGDFAEKQNLGQQGSVPITEQESASMRAERDSSVVQDLQSQAGLDERSVLDLPIEERARLFVSTGLSSLSGELGNLESPLGDIGKLDTEPGQFSEQENSWQGGSGLATEQDSANLRTESASSAVPDLQAQAISDEGSVFDLSIEERARLFLSTGLSSLETAPGGIEKLSTGQGELSEKERSVEQSSVPVTEHDSTNLGTKNVSPVVPDLQSQVVSNEGSVFDLSIEERARLFLSTELSSLETASGGIKKLSTGQGDLSEKERSVQQGSVPVTENDSTNLGTNNVSPVVPDLQSQVVSNEGSVFDLSIEDRARLFLSTGLSSLDTASGGIKKLSTGQGDLSEKERSVQQSSVPVTENDSTNLGTKNVSPVVPDLQSQVLSNERSVLDLSIQERARLFVNTGLSSILRESGSSTGQGEFSETENLGQQGSVPVSELSSVNSLSTEQDESSKRLRDTRDQLRQKLQEIRKGAEGLRVLRESLRARTEWRDKEETKSGVLEESNKVNNDRTLSLNDSGKVETFGEFDIASSGLQPGDERNSQEAKDGIFSVNGVQGPERIADYDYHSDGLSWEADQPDGVVPEREETIAAQMGPILQAKLQLESALDATSKQQDRDRIIFSILAKQQEIGRLAEKRKELDIQLQEQAQIEIDRLKAALQLREAEVLSLRQELLEMKAELSLVQDKVATDIAQAKVELEEERRKLQDAEVAVSRLKKVSVEWWGEGAKVELAGSFNGWQHFFQFQPDLRSEIPNFDGSRGPMLWGLDLLLYPGVYEIKFIVDGIWTIDHRREMVMRDFSVQNNLLRVDP